MKERLRYQHPIDSQLGPVDSNSCEKLVYEQITLTSNIGFTNIGLTNIGLTKFDDLLHIDLKANLAKRTNNKAAG